MRQSAAENTAENATGTATRIATEIATENSVELEVMRWSAWAPGLEDAPSWRAWAGGTKCISGEIKPDVRFVERLLRRRLSPLNRMAFRVAADCLEGDETHPHSVFCSRYGEFSRAFEILNNLVGEEPVSPMTFSLSVHNTASSLFSIMRQDTSHSTALAAGEASLEAGFLECWTLLKERVAPTALLVYCDQTLPEMFSTQENSVCDNAALAFLLRLPEVEESQALSLSWCSSRNNPSGVMRAADNSALRVLKLLLTGGEPIASNFGRLTWEWKCDGAAV
ncbi:MAG: 3-oxoacyl-ACP synthase [Rhodospirillaceae bacterium]|nr:3-oxoacyl-ACP synthase [Rhodospirillaceae bacterium]MBT6831070.1 3-oxoacyl-ACP synthase [Rhodospirillaceae bacterium]MBT7291397.1 3-oxoacyl-ACP synthase [Rhodospirillaceae bacterium]